MAIAANRAAADQPYPLAGVDQPGCDNETFCKPALGYQLGLKGRRVHLLVVLLTLMWTAVIVDILDLASPRIGASRPSTAFYDCTLNGFKGGLQIPPLPAPR